VGEGFTPADLRLLGDLARQASTAIHAVQLTMNLQRVREELILARETRAVVADVRRVVYGLRPPALDELGLIGAVRELATQQSQEATQISCELPEELPMLPAAV